jgi:hypothetical protein
MAYGQEQIDALADDRGVVPSNAAADIRRMRVAEMWARYDSIVIGEGAADKSRGWFNSWADMAAADSLEFFSGRSSNAGAAYTNQNTERTDWAQDLYQTRIEFIAPPGLSELESDPNDGKTMPILFCETFPNQMFARVVLAESDEIAKAPCRFFPAGLGGAFGQVFGAQAPGAIGQSNGDPHVSNAWVWPDPILLAAKAKLTVKMGIDAPLRQLLQGLAGPGHKSVPDGSGGTRNVPNWYTIRVSNWGPRYLQLRGARSSS